MINADNLIFLSPISIRLPSELYDLIDADARLFGFRKNGKSNINGFLNELLPSIIEAQSSIMAPAFFTNSDEQTTNFLKGSVFFLDAIFKPLLKGNNVTISFRVNKAHERDFQKIYDNILPVYNMDFSTLLRSLLTFYVINRLAIRERLVYFKNYMEISNAIAENKQCLFFLKGESFRLSCAAILVSPISDRNVLLGIDPATGKISATPFALIERAIIQNEDGVAIKKHLKLLRKAFLEYLKVEKQLK